MKQIRLKILLDIYDDVSMMEFLVSNITKDSHIIYFVKKKVFLFKYKFSLMNWNEMTTNGVNRIDKRMSQIQNLCRYP